MTANAFEFASMGDTASVYLGAGEKSGQDHLLWAKPMLSFWAEADEFVQRDQVPSLIKCG